jgi:hypothetical protein
MIGGAAAQREPAGATKDARVELLARAAGEDQGRRVQLVRDDRVPVGVEDGADDAVPAPRVADEETEGPHPLELVPVAPPGPPAKDLL